MAGRKSRAAVNRLSFPVFWQPLSGNRLMSKEVQTAIAKGPT